MCLSSLINQRLTYGMKSAHDAPLPIIKAFYAEELERSDF